MFYFILVWTVLIFICLTIGTGILNLFQANYLNRKNDRFILSIWLGIISLTILFLVISFILPLSPLVGLCTYLLLFLISFLFEKTRNEIKYFLRLINLKYLFIYLLIAFIVSALTTQKIIWFDTGLYHWGSIKWLSQFGTVYGVGLINPKFGFNAAWFAFSAPLYSSVLKSNIGAISNGFLFLIGIIHFLISLKYLLNKKLFISDSFIIAYYCFILPICTISSLTKYNILVSFSPDIPVNFLIGIISWAMLLISNQQESNQQDNIFFTVKIIPLFLSLGTICIKLSALPLLPITFVFFVIFTSNKLVKIKRFIISILFCILLLMPMFIYGIKTTGCPLYPSSFLCFNLPWSINQKVIDKERNQIIGISPTQSSQNYFIFLLNRRLQWFKSSTELKIMSLLIIFSVIFSVIIIKKRNHLKSIKGYTWLLGLGFLGMTFIMAQIPLIRFGLGYFCLISSLFLAIFLLPKLPEINKLSYLINQVIFMIIISFISVILIFNNSIQKRLLFPLELPKPKVIKANINDVKYVYPDKNTKCWDEKLPCSPSFIKHDIKLKNPKKGIGGGFINQNQNK